MKKLSFGVLIKGCICLLLLLGIISLCIIGKMHIKVKDKKIYSGAQEVINISSQIKGLGSYWGFPNPLIYFAFSVFIELEISSLILVNSLLVR